MEEGTRLPMLTFSLSGSINFDIWALGINTSFKCHDICDTMNINIGSMNLKSTHLILFRRRQNHLPYLANISLKFASSLGEWKSPPPPPTNSNLHLHFSDEGVPILFEFHMLGFTCISFILCQLSNGKGVVIDFTFMSTIMRNLGLGGCKVVLVS